LLLGRPPHNRVAVANNHRPKTAHQIGVLLAVDIPDLRTFAALEELREGGVETTRFEVAVNPAWYYPIGTLKQSIVDRPWDIQWRRSIVF
jgi:hypothetical protein